MEPGLCKHFAAIYDCRFIRNAIICITSCGGFSVRLSASSICVSLQLVEPMDPESDVDNIYEVEKILDVKRKVS